MDNRVKVVLEREAASQAHNIELREKYRRLLRRTLLEFDSPGKQHIVYENEDMLNKVQNELDGHIKIMENLACDLDNKVKNTEKKLIKADTDNVQHRIEVLNQQIRILEATVRYIKD
jgi:hypothetical protein